MIALDSLRIRIRSLLHVRQMLQRQLPRRSSKPRIGAQVVQAQQGLRFVVQAGMSDDLWKWLMDQGWRVESYRPDRRRYLDIPASWVIALIDAEPAFRDQVLGQATQSAQPRAALAQGLY